MRWEQKPYVYHVKMAKVKVKRLLKIFLKLNVLRELKTLTFTSRWPGLYLYWKVCLFGVLRRFQHCTGHITTGSWKGRGNQYIEFARVVYCKLPTNGKQLPAFPLEPVRGSNPGLRGGRRECYHSATVAPLYWKVERK